MKRHVVALLGGAGFIGRALARFLLEAGHAVVIADNRTTPAAEPPPAGAVDFDLDLAEPAGAEAALSKRVAGEPVDAVFCLAAWQGYGEELSRFGRINAAGAYAFWEAFVRGGHGAHVRHVVLSSSQSVYPGGLIMAREEQASASGAPASAYGWSKWQQERTFVRFAEEFDVPLTALRYSVVLGPGQSLQPGLSYGILRRFWERRAAGLGPALDGDGSQVRDFVHVDDVTDLHARVLRTGVRGVFNAPGMACPVARVAEIFSRAAGAPPAVETANVRPGGNFSLTSSGERVRRLLDWQPQLDVEAQVVDYVRWRTGLEGEDGRKEAAARRDPDDAV